MKCAYINTLETRYNLTHLKTEITTKQEATEITQWLYKEWYYTDKNNIITQCNLIDLNYIDNTYYATISINYNENLLETWTQKNPKLIQTYIS